MNLFLFSILILSFRFFFKDLSSFYILDEPDDRKLHLSSIPQTGGLVFVSIFIIGGWYLNILPSWMLIGSFVSLLLGSLDDNFDIHWTIKLIVQLLLAAFLAYNFWDRFAELSFYNYSLSINQISLLIIFFIWFVGIYNAVNLIDGLDGLAGSYLVLLCISLSLIGSPSFAQITIFLLILLIVFLIFNQRPARVFMGDGGSLFLGYFVAVLPLLYMDLSESKSTVLDMTNFIILSSYLIADTTRVFFTRLLSGKSPMTADTIHFHHLILQRSGSYLTTLFIILLFTTASSLFAILNFANDYNQIGMLIHISIIFLFILTPPAPTYVKLINKFVVKTYSWNKESKYSAKNSFPRTFLSALIIILLLSSIIINANYNSINIYILLSIVTFSLFILSNRNDKIVFPALKVFILFYIFEVSWTMDLGFISNLLSILSIISITIFTLQGEHGTAINNYSALDVLLFFILIGGLFLYIQGHPLNFEVLLASFGIWFNLHFVLSRTIYK